MDLIITTQIKIVWIILNKNKSFHILYASWKVTPIQHLNVFKELRLFHIKSGNKGSTHVYHDTRSN